MVWWEEWEAAQAAAAAVEEVLTQAEGAEVLAQRVVVVLKVVRAEALAGVQMKVEEAEAAQTKVVEVEVVLMKAGEAGAVQM